MEQARLIFLAAMTAAAVALGSAPKPPDGTLIRSLLDDLAPEPSLRSLATAERDFRGCGGDWIHVADFWAVDVAELYRLTGAVVTDQDNESIRLIKLSIASAEQEENR